MERLRVHLKPIEQKAEVSIFSDENIKTDEAWREKIVSEIEDSPVGVLLVSADFLASEFVNDEELPRLFRGRFEKKKRLVTVFLSPCAYSLYPEIAGYQGFNDPGRPFSELKEFEREKLLADLAVNLLEMAIDAKQAPSGAEEKSEERWEELEEPDYSSIAGQRLHSRKIISLPRLLSVLDEPSLVGFSFENCWIKGPGVLAMRASHIENSTFDVPNADFRAMIFRPICDVVVGVVDASNMNVHGCRLSNVAFLDPDGSLEKKLTGN